MDIENNKKQQRPLPETTGHKFTIGTYVFLAVITVAAYFIFRTRLVDLPDTKRKLFMSLTLAAAIGAVVLAAAALAVRIIAKHSREKSQRYNLVQFIRLISVIVVILIFVSFLFQNWYTAAVSLGLISLILGFALQTPISSFIGWLYIIFRSPYHVGDRIQIDTFTGDVVEIGYLDTTLWEFGGNYLTNDVPSGRLIRFPNSLILQEAVYNYSWQKFPYIWNEIPFHVAYESDLQYVETILKSVATTELGDEIFSHVKELKELVKKTPIDELEIKEIPFVSFRTNTNTWIEVSLMYPVDPKKASAIRSRILKHAVAELLKQPSKVMFPNSNAR